jgi:hypothetical protein
MILQCLAAIPTEQSGIAKKSYLLLEIYIYVGEYTPSEIGTLI